MQATRQLDGGGVLAARGAGSGREFRGQRVHTFSAESGWEEIPAAQEINRAAALI